ncbi:MAG: hypothetical protein Q8L12_14560, partial [Methylibium sp.]|nr:hypothetical protein [Methylibium sp.]
MGRLHGLFQRVRDQARHAAAGRALAAGQGLVQAVAIEPAIEAVEQTAQSDTTDMIKQAEKAIRDFYSIQGRLPCAAPITNVVNPGAA